MTVFFVTRELQSVRSLVTHLRSVPTGELVTVNYTPPGETPQVVTFMFDPDRQLIITHNCERTPRWVTLIRVFLNHPVHQGGQPHHDHHDPDRDPDLEAEGPSGQPPDRGQR